MKTIHFLLCEAPICIDDQNPNFRNKIVWLPGEKICSKTPYAKFQKKQIEINKLVQENKFKNMDRGYTANDLENRSI